MKNIMKKVVKSLPFFALLVSMIGVVTVYASSYRTSLSLGSGYYLLGSSRYYTRGMPGIQIYPQYYVKYCEKLVIMLHKYFLIINNYVTYTFLLSIYNRNPIA